MKPGTRRSKPFLCVLTCLSIALASLGASAQPEPGSTTPPPPPVPPSGGFRVVGVLWYLRSHAAMDDLTLVYGGLQGSAALVYRDQTAQKSHWFLLEGGSLFVASDHDAPWYTSTSSRGKFITTTRPFDWSAPKEGNRRELSWLLADLYDLSKAVPTDPNEGELRDIRHAPFFIGKGWTNAKGATWAEVQDLCDSLGLVPQVQTATTQGFVNQQLPLGGTLMTPGTGDNIQIWFDQTPPSSIPLVAGDSWLGPMPVEDADGDGVAIVNVEVTASHTDDAKSPVKYYDGTPVNRNRKDVFLRLPPEAKYHKVTVKLVEPRDRMILTAWKVVGGSLANVPSGDRTYTAQLGLQPTLEYVHDSDDIVLMVEFDTRNTGNAVLKIEW